MAIQINPSISNRFSLMMIVSVRMPIEWNRTTFTDYKLEETSKSLEFKFSEEIKESAGNVEKNGTKPLIKYSPNPCPHLKSILDKNILD